MLLGHMLPMGTTAEVPLPSARPRSRDHSPQPPVRGTGRPVCGWRAPGHPPGGGGVSRMDGDQRDSSAPRAATDGRAGETQGRAAWSRCFGREGPQRGSPGRLAPTPSDPTPALTKPRPTQCPGGTPKSTRAPVKMQSISADEKPPLETGRKQPHTLPCLSPPEKHVKQTHTDTPGIRNSEQNFF